MPGAYGVDFTHPYHTENREELDSKASIQVAT
jgi:hypothetical protein